MNDSLVKLVFECISKGSGWADLRKNAVDSLKNINHFGGALKSVGTAVGTMGGVIGRAISAFAMGNIWGAATVGITALINKFGIFKDKSEEVKKSLDEQKKAHDALLSSITSGYSAALAKIDSEAAKRKELVDLINRQTKAQLELSRAQAVMSGDTSSEAVITDRLSKLDGEAAKEKADADVAAAEKRVKAARDALASAQRLSRQAEDRRDSALDKARGNRWELTRSAGGGVQIGTGKYAYRDEDVAAVKAAEVEAAAAESKVEAARKALEAEMEGLAKSRMAQKTAILERQAAEKKSDADAVKKAREKTEAEKKAREAADKAADKAAHQRALDEAAALAKSREEEAKEEALTEAQEQRRTEAELHRRRLDYLRKEADLYRQELEDAHARLASARDIMGNAANMDQAGEESDARQEEIDDRRYEERARKLKERIKAAGGDVSKLGRLSNIDRAVYDRMQAEADVQKSGDTVASIDHKMDTLIQKITELTSL